MNTVILCLSILMHSQSHYAQLQQFLLVNSAGTPWLIDLTALIHLDRVFDLLVMEKDGQITNARLIDKMTPIQK